MTKNEKLTITGIVAEYNPFHNGHEYHIKKAKELSQAGCCIVVMSGDFTQRGAPAIYDKYTRTAMALSSGADLVLELPAAFATSSAEDFASCAVSILSRCGVVDTICFGSECGDVKPLSRIASILATEPPIYTDALKKQLKKGATFPEARSAALISSGCISAKDAKIPASPNNILGIEYCKALLAAESPIRPITIARQGSGYHDTDMESGYASASAIRGSLSENDLSPIRPQVPSPVYSLMEQAFPVFPDDFSTLLNGRLLRLSMEEIPFHTFADVSEELSARISRSVLDFASFEDRILSLKTRQYTYTRISRALLHILLGIRDTDILSYRQAGYAPYARVLGFRKSSAAVLTEIKKRGQLPLITKTADAHELLDSTAQSMFNQDLYCSHLYQAVVQGKHRVRLKNEYTRSVILV